MSRRLPYYRIANAAAYHANKVMNALPKDETREQREHWAVAFEAFKRGARWALKGKR
jgi:hypothetical protein